jgi:hypothetical protein
MSRPEDDMRKLLLIGISTFALGAAAMASADQLTRTKGQDTYKMLELFGDVLVKVKQQYVVPVDDVSVTVVPGHKFVVEAGLEVMVGVAGAVV